MVRKHLEAAARARGIDLNDDQEARWCVEAMVNAPAVAVRGAVARRALTIRELARALDADEEVLRAEFHAWRAANGAAAPLLPEAAIVRRAAWKGDRDGPRRRIAVGPEEALWRRLSWRDRMLVSAGGSVALVALGIWGSLNLLRPAPAPTPVPPRPAVTWSGPQSAPQAAQTAPAPILARPAPADPEAATRAAAAAQAMVARLTALEASVYSRVPRDFRVLPYTAAPVGRPDQTRVLFDARMAGWLNGVVRDAEALRIDADAAMAAATQDQRRRAAAAREDLDATGRSERGRSDALRARLMEIADDADKRVRALVEGRNTAARELREALDRLQITRRNALAVVGRDEAWSAQMVRNLDAAEPQFNALIEAWQAVEDPERVPTLSREIVATAERSAETHVAGEAERRRAVFADAMRRLRSDLQATAEGGGTAPATAPSGPATPPPSPAAVAPPAAPVAAPAPAPRTTSAAVAGQREMASVAQGTGQAPMGTWDGLLCAVDAAGVLVGPAGGGCNPLVTPAGWARLRWPEGRQPDPDAIAAWWTRSDAPLRRARLRCERAENTSAACRVANGGSDVFAEAARLGLSMPTAGR